MQGGPACLRDIKNLWQAVLCNRDPYAYFQKTKKREERIIDSVAIYRYECLRGNQILPFDCSPILKTLTLKISCLFHTSLF